MTTNATKTILKTPAGEFIYPWLNKADTKFNADGTYHVKVRLTGADAEIFTETIKNIFDEAVRKAVKTNGGKRLKQQDLPFEEAEDGSWVTVKFKLNAKGVNRTTGQPFEQKPQVYDQNGQPTDSLVTNGSTGIVAFEPVLFQNAALGLGLTLRLKAVKVLNFAPAGQGGFTNVFGDTVVNKAVEAAIGSADDEAYDF